MPRMISPAGEMLVNIHGMDVKGDMIVVAGQFGTWDSHIYMNPRDVWNLIRLIPFWKLVLYVLRFPFASKKSDYYVLEDERVNR